MATIKNQWKFIKEGEEVIKTDHLKIMPVSIIDMAAQKKRKGENHAKTSSRANYSPFPSEISDLCYEFFLRDSNFVVDPFAGWGERGAKAKEYNKEYIGFDTSQLALDKAKEEFGVDNILADSRTVDVPEHNGLITCPPYWNLEKYSADEGIDRIKKWDEFCETLYSIFKRFYDKASVGSTYCIMVGDWRKNHVYYDLEHVISSMFKEFGAHIVDKVICSRKAVSKIKIMLPQAKRLGYTVRVHENLLVFRKND